MDSRPTINDLLRLLIGAVPGDAFNMYAQRDPRLDLPDAPAIRQANLRHYLETHAQARIALIGEAAGYRGCRFSGVPFLSEAQMLALGDPAYRPSSRRGDYDEVSAQRVQAVIGGRDDVICWNAVPWHPHKPGQPISNRRPTIAEQDLGTEMLRDFLAWKQPTLVIALGRIAEDALGALGVPAHCVRHPARSGQRAFQAALTELLARSSPGASAASSKGRNSATQSL
jgi:uracil-DNA glycosylase, family 4